MRYTKVTKSSIMFLTDETEVRKVIFATIEKLGNDYELKVVEESFVTAVELFIGTNCPPSEKQLIVKEILGSYNTMLKESTKHKSV